LCLAAAVWTGCAQQSGSSAVEAGKDASGKPYVHVDGEKVDRNLQQANQDLKQAGREIQQGAENAGKAIERGADKVNEKIGPEVREVMDDAGISAKVKAKLLADPEVHAFHIDVDTVDGRVSLNGKVASQEERAEAEKLASHTEGVKSVVNLIQVAGQEPPPVPPAQ
jgi:osmotically-inducible protein OsmY